MLSLQDNQHRLIGEFPGMSFSPRFSRDENFVMMSISQNGETHIYEINLKTKEKVQLTTGNSMNTSASYSPDGKQIVFNSDRHGSRQIFIMDRNGSSVTRVSFGVGVYTEPDWSNRNYIVFTKFSQDLGFVIGILKPNKNNEQHNTEKSITSGYLVESPAWSTNSNMLVFTRGSAPTMNNVVNGLHKIYQIDSNGRNQRIIPTPYDASDPHWSSPID